MVGRKLALVGAGSGAEGVGSGLVRGAGDAATWSGACADIAADAGDLV